VAAARARVETEVFGETSHKHYTEWLIQRVCYRMQTLAVTPIDVSAESELERGDRSGMDPGAGGRLFLDSSVAGRGSGLPMAPRPYDGCWSMESAATNVGILIPARHAGAEFGLESMRCLR
jgi:hypothetical protein